MSRALPDSPRFAYDDGRPGGDRPRGSGLVLVGRGGFKPFVGC